MKMLKDDKRLGLFVGVNNPSILLNRGYTGGEYERRKMDLGINGSRTCDP